MASVQRMINFPEKKRFTNMLSTKKGGKENNFDFAVPPTKSPNICKGSPAKRSNNSYTMRENGASPPKARKSLSDVDSTDPTTCEKAEDSQISSLNDVAERLSNNDHSSTEDDGLSKAIRVLHSSQPTKLFGREDHVNKISTVLLESLKNRESSTLYISGPPGTGKTACINYILSQPQIRGQFKIVYINCTGLKSAGAAFKRIGEGLGLKTESSEKKTQISIEKHLTSYKKMIILVLDEMDQLESKKQSLLYTIFEWPSLYKSNLVLLGIANALDLTDRVLPRLQAKLDLAPKLFHFPSYSKEEIIEILTNRLKEGGVDQVLNGGALQLLAGKVAAVSGDIRKALDIGRRVIELAQTKSGSGQKVALLDVLAVVNNVYGTSVTLDNSDQGESFPLHQKVLICTLVLFKKNSKVKEISIGRLHDVYKKVCTKRNLASLDISEFISVAELVESRGAIRIVGKIKNRLSKVVLHWDETEISNTLQDKQFIASILDDVSCLK